MKDFWLDITMDSNNTINRSLQGVYVAFWVNQCFGLVGLVLNISVFLIIITHSILRQPFNYLILNLSFTDALLSSAVMLNGMLDYFSISHSISHRASSIICYISTGLVVVSLPAACLTLLIMSIERYQAIAIVRYYKVKLSTVCKVIPIAWLLAIMTAIIPMIHASVDQDYPYQCTMGRIDHFHMLVLLLASFSITSFLPIGMMLIVYAMIFYKLMYDLSIVQPTSSLVMGRREKHSRRSILPVLCISIFSATSSVPYLILSYYTFVNQYYNPLFREPFAQKQYELWVVTATLFILTPIVNPLLYNLASSKFRKVLYSLICGRYYSVTHTTATPIRRLIINRVAIPIQNDNGNCES